MAIRSVLISGAGIAGPALAYWLHKAGLRSTIVERAPRLRGGGYVIDFWGLGYDIAVRMGLKADLDRFGYHVQELRIVGDDGNRIACFGTGVFNELTGGRYVTLRRSDLSRIVFSRVMDHTEVIFGDEIAQLTDDADGILVRFAKGDERRFDLVIGADGLHSTVRELAFGPERIFEVGLGYAVAAFETSDYPHRDENVYLMYCKPGRMIGRFTERDRRALFLFVMATAGKMAPRGLAARKAFLRDRFAAGRWESRDILSALDQTEEIYFDRISQIQMSHWSKGRVALIGDAAFCVSLTAGQGSALAILSAYVLAGELARSQGDHREAFRRYEALLKPFIVGKQRGAERFARVFAPRTALGLNFRNMIMRSLAIPGLARLGAGRDIMDRLGLPDYSWRD
jgi:2-polyprenyl-6-methoxyphenol hydroxylase-like FAD-dependent oxidoreductase